MSHVRYEGNPDQFAELEAAVRRAVGPCSCGPLMRRIRKQVCRSCELVDETLAKLLASETADRPRTATVQRWQVWRECPEVFRLREPIR